MNKHNLCCIRSFTRVDPQLASPLKELRIPFIKDWKQLNINYGDFNIKFFMLIQYQLSKGLSPEEIFNQLLKPFPSVETIVFNDIRYTTLEFFSFLSVSHKAILESCTPLPVEMEKVLEDIPSKYFLMMYLDIRWMEQSSLVYLPDYVLLSIPMTVYKLNFQALAPHQWNRDVPKLLADWGYGVKVFDS